MKRLIILASVSGAVALAAGGYLFYAQAVEREAFTSTSASLSAGVDVRAGGPFPLHEEPQPVADLRFVDGQGQETSLRAFEGKIVLLNVWATWCVPCREEMPALGRLQARLGGASFQVIPLSIDRGGLEQVKEFYQELGLEALPIYHDPSGKAGQRLQTMGIPTTLLINAEGEEIGRLVGPTEWSSPEMIALLQREIGSTTAALARSLLLNREKT